MSPRTVSVSLPSDPRLRRVLVAYGFRSLIEFSSELAIMLVAYDRGGAGLAGLTAFAQFLPAVFAVPVLAGLIDKLPRGRALVLTHGAVGVTAAITALALGLSAPFWAIVFAAALLTSAVGLVRPMHFAALPRLAGNPGDLVRANGLSTLLEGFSVFVGFVCAGILVEEFGAWLVLGIGAALGFSASALCANLGIPVARAHHHESAESELAAALEGLKVLSRSLGAMALLVLIAMTTVIQGANEVLNVNFAHEVLHAGESTAGLLAGMFGIGMALGGAVLAGQAHRRNLAPIVLIGALAIGGAQSAVAGMSALIPAMLMLALVGAGASMILVASRTLLQRSTEDHVLAKVLAVQEGVFLLGLTLGTLVGPLLITALGAQWAYVPLGLSMAALGLASFRWTKKLDAASTVRLREVTLLSRVPFLAAMAPYELERLAMGAEWRNAPAGERVVTQGDEADSYYLVAEGELSVTVDGRLREHTLTAGEGFGEISLLHRVPRTATVTALQDCELLVVTGESFLAAVTQNADGAALARELSASRLAADHQSHI